MMSGAVPSDAVLWSRVLAGDPQALALIYERHATSVFNHCYQRVLSVTDAEDLTAEVFLALIKPNSRLRVVGEAGVLPWLLGIANNLLRRHRAAEVSARRLSAALAAIRDDSPDVGDEVAGAAADHHRLTVIAAVLHGLPPEDQDVIQLCVVQALSPGVVAAMTGHRPGTVRSRLSRALRRARRRLAALDAEVSNVDPQDRPTPVFVAALPRIAPPSSNPGRRIQP
jgi:RNA polymerase sigma-70 factor (ECF subfamily)